MYHTGIKEELGAGEIADRLLSSAAPGCENIAGRIGLSRDVVNRADIFLYGEPDSAISHSANRRAYKRDLRRAPARLQVYADWGRYSYDTVIYVGGLLRETRAKAMREIASLLAKAKRLGIGISLLHTRSSPTFSHSSAADAVREAVLEVHHASRWDAGRRLAARLAGMGVPERHAEILMQDYWDQAAHLKPGPYRRSKVMESLRSAYRKFRQ